MTPDREKLALEALQKCVDVIEGFKDAGKLAEGFHAGLRKGTDAADAGSLWKAIAASRTSAWGDAAAFAIDPYFSMWGGNKALAEAREALALLAETAPSGPVRVKPLEWTEPSTATNGCWYGNGSLHWRCGLYDQGYSISHDGPLYYVIVDDGRHGEQQDIGKFRTLDAAKAAAQADYERRVLSAIETAPSGEGEPVAKDRQRTICGECGNSNLLASEAIWTDDDSSFCPGHQPSLDPAPTPSASEDRAGEDRLREIRERVEKATPGPWAPSVYGFQVLTGDSWGTICETHVRGNSEPTWEDGRGPASPEANADFIAHAREDVPFLLSALTARDETIARLTRENADLRAADRDHAGVARIREDRLHAAEAKVSALEARLAVMGEALREMREAIAFFDRVRMSPLDEQIPVGQDHWNWLESAARKAAALEQEGRAE